MGSSNSTRWDNTRTRLCVESCFTLAPPQGRLRPGSCSVEWQRGRVVVWCVLARDGGGFTMSVRHNWHGGGPTQFVRLEATRPHFGGVRWWYCCPACGSRVSRLHLPGRGRVVHEFKCRACYDLSYESAQGSRSKPNQLWRELARRWNCSTREARDTFRQNIGGHVHWARQPYFGSYPAEIEV